MQAGQDFVESQRLKEARCLQSAEETAAHHFAEIGGCEILSNGIQLLEETRYLQLAEETVAHHSPKIIRTNNNLNVM